jgi:hypothetical protein
LAACGGGDADSAAGHAAHPAADAAVSGLAKNPEVDATSSEASTRKSILAAGAVNGSVATAFTDVLADDETLTAIKICGAALVDSVTLITNVRTHDRVGGPGGHCTTFSLNADEIPLLWQGTARRDALTSLSVTTSQGRTFGPVGDPYQSGATPFSLTLTYGPSSRFRGLVGFHSSPGSNPQVLMQLGLIGEGIGGDGGRPFVDRMAADEVLTSMDVCHRSDWMVNKIRLNTSVGARSSHGADMAGQSCVNIQFAAGEYITEISGGSGLYLDRLALMTNQGRQFGPYGGPGGKPFRQVADNGRFLGLFGRSGAWIDRIGLVTSPGGWARGEQTADQLPSGKTVSAVNVCVGNGYGSRVVQSLQALFDQGSSSLPLHGGSPRPGDTVCERINFDSGEFITHMLGSSGAVLDNISFVTNRGRTFGPYGGPGGPRSFVVVNPYTDGFLGFATYMSQAGTGDGGTIRAIDFAAPDVYAPSTPPTAAAASQGWWSSLGGWPIIGMHLSLLPDGRVMNFGSGSSGAQGAQFVYDVWNPKAGLGARSHLTLPNTLGTDIFCSAQSLLPNGQLMLAGGDGRESGINSGIRKTTLFNPQTNELNDAGVQLKTARWYATQVQLASGRVLAIGGTDDAYKSAWVPEIYTHGSGWRSLPGLASLNVTSGYYPRAFVVGQKGVNADVVYLVAYNRRIYKLGIDDNQGAGSLQDTGVSLPADASWDKPVAPVGSNAVMMALNDGQTVIVRFPWDPAGKPLVDLSGQMSQVRSWGNFTTLPTGEVLATNGSAVYNQLNGVAHHAEIWKPTTRTWTPLAKEMRPRLYHAASMLLADGRVLSTGGGAPGPLLNMNAQVFSPPYLFASDGSAAVRPRIISAPSTLGALTGKDVSIGVDNAADVSRVSLMRLGSVTHSFNMGQSYQTIPFEATSAGTLSISVPTNRGVTPGFYLLSIVNRAGVPSEGKVVRIFERG